MLGFFVSEAGRRPQFFRCIADQFEEFGTLDQAKALLQRRMSGQASEFDGQFVDTTWSYMGQLVALSLYYLSGFDSGDDGFFQFSARKLLANIVVSAATIRPRDAFLPLLARIEGLNNLSFRALVALSQELAVAFAFCREGFLAQALAVEYGARIPAIFFSCLLEPWFENISLGRNGPGIAPGCEQVCLSRFAFLELFIREFCQRYPLQPPVIDLLAKLKDVEVLFVEALRLSRNFNDQCLNFLRHLCLTHASLVEKVGEILTFQYWYFEMIHLSQCDRDFDAMKEAPGFMSLTSFACNLASSLLKLAPKQSVKLIPALLSFCFVKKCQQSHEIIQQRLGFATDSIEAIANFLTEGQRQEFAQHCFDWAVACGEVSRASQAAIGCLGTLAESSTNRVELVMRTLKICLMVLKAVEESNASQADGHFMRVKYKSDLREFHNYIANLLNLLSKLNLMLPSPSEKVVKTITGFLACCCSSNFSTICEAVVDSIHDHVMKGPEFIHIPDSSTGIISDIRHYQLSQPNGRATVDKLCEIIFFLTKARAVSLLLKSGTPQAATAAAILLILPYASAVRGCLEELSKLCHHALGILLTGSSICDAIHLLVAKMDNHHVKIVFQVIANTIAEVPEYSSTVFHIASEILSARDTHQHSGHVTKIYQKATRDRDWTNSDSACRFLSVCRSLSISDTAQTPPKPAPFPGIVVYSDFVLSEIDDSVIPPLCLIDFNGIEIVARLRRNCAAIQFKCFSQWYRAVVAAEVHQVELPLFVNIEWNSKMYDVFCEFLAKLAPRALSVRRPSSFGFSRPQMSLETVLNVDPALFTPEPEEMAAVCPELRFPLIRQFQARTW
jgi:hypothetical protein